MGQENTRLSARGGRDAVELITFHSGQVGGSVQVAVDGICARPLCVCGEEAYVRRGLDHCLFGQSKQCFKCLGGRTASQSEGQREKASGAQITCLIVQSNTMSRDTQSSFEHQRGASSTKQNVDGDSPPFPRQILRFEPSKDARQRLAHPAQV